MASAVIGCPQGSRVDPEVSYKGKGCQFLASSYLFPGQQYVGRSLQIVVDISPGFAQFLHTIFLAAVIKP